MLLLFVIKRKACANERNVKLALTFYSKCSQGSLKSTPRSGEEIKQQKNNPLRHCVTPPTSLASGGAFAMSVIWDLLYNISAVTGAVEQVIR